MKGSKINFIVDIKIEGIGDIDNFLPEGNLENLNFIFVPDVKKIRKEVRVVDLDKGVEVLLNSRNFLFSTSVLEI